MSNSNEHRPPNASGHVKRESGPRAIGDVLANSELYSKIQQASAQSDHDFVQGHPSSIKKPSTAPDTDKSMHENTPAGGLTDSVPLSESDTHSSSQPGTDASIEISSPTSMDASRYPGSHPNTESNTQTDSETDTQTGIEPNMQAGNETDMQPDSLSGAQPGSQVDMVADSLGGGHADMHMQSDAGTLMSGQANTQSSSPVNRTPQPGTLNGQGARTAPKGKSGKPSGQSKKHTLTEAPVVYLGEFPQVRTQQQERLLKVFQSAPHCRTTLGGLSRKLQIPYGSVRRILARLRELELIRFEHVTEKGFQGLEVWYLGQDDMPTIIPIGEPAAGEPGGADRPNTPSGHPINIEEREKEKKQKTLSVWDISVESIEALWPHAQQAGLFPHHIRQVREAFMQQGRSEDGLEKLIAQTLRYLEWQLENGGILDRAGNRVDSPVQYWLKSMQRNGCYDKPKGYVDPHLLALQEVESEEAQLLAAQKRVQNLRDEQEKEARKNELQQILEELAAEGEKHSLWSQVYDSLPAYSQAKIAPQGSRAILEDVMVRHMAWIALKRIFCVSDDTAPS